jgi:hypothetical protein
MQTFLRTLCASLVLSAALAASALAAHAHPDAYCADRLCHKDAPGQKSCWHWKSRANESKCFITRAARHFHQSRSQALYIAYRESRYDYRVTNSSSGAAGLYQFMPTTWHHTPYRSKSPYNPRWASLAAMYMWAHGGYHHWE